MNRVVGNNSNRKGINIRNHDDDNSNNKYNKRVKGHDVRLNTVNLVLATIVIIWIIGGTFLYFKQQQEENHHHGEHKEYKIDNHIDHKLELKNIHHLIDSHDDGNEDNLNPVIANFDQKEVRLEIFTGRRCKQEDLTLTVYPNKLDKQREIEMFITYKSMRLYGDDRLNSFSLYHKKDYQASIFPIDECVEIFG